MEYDEDGTDLPDFEAAKLAASHLAGAVLQETPGAIWRGESRSIDITDTSGTVLGTVHVMSVVSLAASD